MKVCPRCSELYPDDVNACPRDDSELRTVLDPMIGRTVGGRFRLISRIGSGGMSTVYLARHVLIDRLMAIKVLRSNLARDPKQRHRFLREARAVNRINHENIVEITDFGQSDDGLVYLVMEYVPGESLLKVMSDGPMKPVRALNAIEQCASALARAHQMGVIHRDLKPENILVVERRGGGEFIKLLDFGIAKILDAPSLTGSQQIFGTPGYIAPEYIQSTEIDGRADLYSLGCILYEMITGALPFDYEYPGDLLIKHVTELPIRPRERLPSVEPAVEDFIMRCLVKDPNKRFRDAYHFNTELRLVRERLGPGASWGGLNEASDQIPLGRVQSPNQVMRVGGPASDWPTGDIGAGERVVPPTLREGLIGGLDRAAASEPPPSPPESETPELGLQIPQAPALDGAIAHEVLEAGVDALRVGETPTPHVNSDGLVGALGWRRRFDALENYLRQLRAIEPVPASLLEAQARAASTLGELEDAVASAQGYQEAVEQLHDRARDFRSTLGRAIDQLAGRLSNRRGIFGELAQKRKSLRAARESCRSRLRQGLAKEGEADALLWEQAAVEEELRLEGGKCDALESKLVELTEELDASNETFEGERFRLAGILDAQMLLLEDRAAGLRRPMALVEDHLRLRQALLRGPEG